MGLLEVNLPPIQLHASTQTDNRNPEKVRFLQDAGFSQVVLARELSLNEIINIYSQTTVALEYFVHGALCVAYSGQCYISHAHTGRSANRGECSQACRLPYTLVDDKGKTHHREPAPAVDEGQQPERQPAGAGAGRGQLVQDRGAAEGSLLRQEHHRALPHAARRHHRRPPGIHPRLVRALYLHLHAAAGQDLQPRLHRLLRQRPPGRHRRLRLARLRRGSGRRGRGDRRWLVRRRLVGNLPQRRRRLLPRCTAARCSACASTAPRATGCSRRKCRPN